MQIVNFGMEVATYICVRGRETTEMKTIMDFFKDVQHGWKDLKKQYEIYFMLMRINAHQHRNSSQKFSSEEI